VFFAVACSVVAAAAAPQVQASHFLGTWSTSRLSAARGFFAASSLPEHGIVVFAGGWGNVVDASVSAVCGSW
jgi:hypothetical protein